jgi:hypothetical protein
MPSLLPSFWLAATILARADADLGYLVPPAAGNYSAGGTSGRRRSSKTRSSTTLNAARADAVLEKHLKTKHLDFAAQKQLSF